jgi:outer membrane lipoprotein-sorting protein
MTSRGSTSEPASPLADKRAGLTGACPLTRQNCPMRNWVLGSLITVVLLTAASPAAETYTPTALTAEQIFAKAVAARGHLRSGAYHRVSETVRTGGTIRSEVYQGFGDYVETQREGEYTIAFGAHNDVEWQQDENGVVAFVSGFHDTDDPFNAALTKPKSVANSPIRVLGTTTSPESFVVVEVTPLPGLTQRRYYDAKTFLLRRVETTDYLHTWTFDYEDFRTAYGLTFAQTISYHDEHPENAERTTVKTFEPVSPALVHSAVPQSKAVFDLAGRASAQIPAEFTPEGIIVRVTIAGRGLDFELDSGASSIVIDADVARQLGLTVSDVQKTTFDGEFSHGRTRAADFAVGDLRAHNLTLEAIPFNRIVDDRKVVGLLGGDFFASERVSVNFKDHLVSVLAPSKEAPSAPWVTIPIQVDDRVPRAHAKFNAVEGAFIVDLGAFKTMLYPHFFRQFRPNNRGDVMGQVVGVGGQAMDYHEYTFCRLDFGDLAFADASAIVASGAKYEGLDYDGLIGRNILDNFNLIFDYPTGKLYVDSLVP